MTLSIKIILINYIWGNLKYVKAHKVDKKIDNDGKIFVPSSFGHDRTPADNVVVHT